MNKKYWLRGLIIGPVFYLVFYFIIFPFDDMGILTMILSPGTWVLKGIGGLDAVTKYAIQFAISIASWALFGTLVGWIYGKIKNRNRTE